MSNRRTAFAFLIAVVPAMPVHAAESLMLQCEGVLHIYEGGFGSSLPESQPTSVRLVEIDAEAGTASTGSLFGQRTALLTKSPGDRFYSFTLKHNARYKGKLVAEEQVSINRFTGEINAFYVLEPRPKDQLGYASFSGNCKRAERKF